MSPARGPATLALALLLASPSATSPVTIRVPADQPTIAAALAHATSGDEVVVDCGTYAEWDLPVPSGITLRSATGSPDCVSFQRDSRTVLRVIDAADVTIRGFTLSAQSVPAVRVSNSARFTIEDCDFVGSSPTRFTSVLQLGSQGASVTGCRFVENAIHHEESSALNAIGSVTVDECDFEFNSAYTGYGWSMVRLGPTGPHVVTNCRFSENIGGALDVKYSSTAVDDCVIRRTEGGWYSYSPVILTALEATVAFRGCLAESLSRAGNAVVADRSTVLFEGCTLDEFSLDYPFRGAASTIRLDRTILSRQRSRNALFAGTGALSVIITCSDLHDLPAVLFGGGCTADTSRVLFEDPRFCGIAGMEHLLDGASPCLPEASPCGQLIGAYGMGCGVVGVEPMTWGRIKNLYR